MTTNIATKTGLLCSLMLLAFVMSAQTYWDVNTNGQRVKKEISIGYDLAGSAVDTTLITYYANGKIDYYYQNLLIGAPGDQFWSSQLRTYYYQADTLSMIIAKANEEETYEIIEKNRNMIFPIRVNIFANELELQRGAKPSTVVDFGYDKDNRISYRNIKSEYTNNMKFFYEKEGLIRIEGLWEDEYGNSDAWEVPYETRNNDKYGWSERVATIPDGSKIKTTRTVELFTKDELKQSIKYRVKSEALVDYSLSDIIGKWNSLSRDDKYAEEGKRLIEMGIKLFEQDRSKIVYSDYSPTFFYKNIAEYYSKVQPETAILWTKRGIDFIGDSEVYDPKDLIAMTAYLLRDIGQHEEALKFYEMIPPPEFGVYDPMGNFYETTLIKFMMRGGKLEDGRELFSPLHMAAYELVTGEDFKPENTRIGYILHLKHLGEIGELLADQYQGYHGAVFYFKIIKDYFQATEGKESEEYINALKDLIRIKKAIQK